MLILITGHPGSGKSALAKELNWSISCSGRECLVFDDFQNIDLSKPLNFVSTYGEAKDWETFITCAPFSRPLHKIIIAQDAKMLPKFILDCTDLHIQCSSTKYRLFKRFHRFQISTGFGVQDGKVKYKSYPFAGVANV